MMETVAKAVSASKNIADAAADTVDQAMSGAHKVIDKVTDAAGPAVDRIATGAHQAVDKLTGTAAGASNSFENKGGQLKEMQARLGERGSAQLRAPAAYACSHPIGGGLIDGDGDRMRLLRGEHVGRRAAAAWQAEQEGESEGARKDHGGAAYD